MSVIESRDGVELEIGKTSGAAFVTMRPLDYTSKSGEIIGGHYRAVLPTGLITILNAGDAILSARWIEVTKKMVLHRIRLFGVITTPFTNAQEVSFDLVKVNGFSASDTGGTTTVLPLLNAGAGKKRATMQNSVLGDLRVAAATALGASATGVAEGFAGNHGVLSIGNVVGSAAEVVLYDAQEMSGEHPMIFDKNEGFRIRVGITQAAAGVMRVTTVLDWAEVPSF